MDVPEYEIQEWNSRKTRFCVSIPVLNEGERIRAQLERMAPFYSLMDVIIADGGSSDGSMDQELLKKSGIRTLLIKKSSGKLSAQMRMALDYSLKQGYEGVVFMDGNNKDDPSDLPRFEEMLSAGYDHIQGSRFLQGAKAINNPALRIIGIKSIHAPLISLAAGFRYTDTTNGFRAYSRRFLLDARVQPFREVFSEYELHYYLAIRAARLGFKTIEIPVSRIYPPGPIPTHISRFRGNWIVMRTLFMACLGFYNPHSDSLKTA